MEVIREYDKVSNGLNTNPFIGICMEITKNRTRCTNGLKILTTHKAICVEFIEEYDKVLK